MDLMALLPREFSQVADLVKDHDSLVHSFTLDTEFCAYDPTGYLHGVNIDGLNYVVFIDSNILIFLLKAINGVVTEQTKAAVGLVAFCQELRIDIDPELALHELNNYDHSRASKTVERLELFQRLNSTKTDQLYEYSLGREKSISLIPMAAEVDNAPFLEAFGTYNRLVDWDSFYLLALVIVKADLQNGKKEQRLTFFLNWMTHNFRRSLPVLSYSCIYFGLLPSKGMMKYKKDSTVNERKRQVGNMVWDLFMANHVIQAWANPDDNTQYLFASFDSAFRDVLRLSIELGIVRQLKPLEKHLSSRAFASVVSHFEAEIAESDRNYYTADDPGDYRASKIKDLEMELGINS